MTDHETLLAQLRHANPVPDPDALIDKPGSTERGAIKKRNHTMPTIHSVIDLEPTAPPRRRRPSLAIAATVAVVVAIGAFALLRPGSGVLAPPEPADVATSFFEAINRADADAWWALHSEDAFAFGASVSDESGRQSYQDYFDWRTTVQSQFEDVKCSETGGVDTLTGGDAVSCDYVWRGPIQDRFGVTMEGHLLMAVEDGKIVNLTSDNPDFGSMQGFPIQYLSENHGTDFSLLCGGGPGAFNGGEECALLYMDNLDAMVEAWEAENG